MTRVLCAWELGAGTGHLHHLGFIAAGLRAAGHEALVAVRDVTTAESVLGDSGLAVLPAPFWGGRVSGLPPSASYAEMLLRVGYLTPAVVRGLVKSWRAMFQAINVEAVIAEHAPSALLAARLCGLPRICVGTGFMIPPAATPSPSVQPWAEITRKRLETAESRVLGVISEALAPIGGIGLDTLAELFAVEAQFLVTFEELDHFGTRRLDPSCRDTGRAFGPYWGPLGAASELPEPIWPDASRERIFMYMHPSYPQFAPMVRALVEIGLPTLVVAPGIAAGRAAELSTGRLAVSPRQVDLNRVAEQARVVVHHAGHGVAGTLIEHGAVQLLVPNFVEQWALAVRFARHGSSMALLEDPAERGSAYVAAIRQLLAEPGFAARAQSIAARYVGSPDRDRYEALNGALSTEIAAWG